MHTLTELIGTVVLTASTIPVLFIATYLYARYYEEKPLLFWILIILLVIIYFFSIYFLYNYLLDIGWIVPCKEVECNLTASW